MECQHDNNNTRTAEQDQVRAFLARLGWSKDDEESVSSSAAVPPPTLDTLRRLHELHVRGPPFENIDLHCGRHITLDLPTLYDKIVTRRRGGFCYELNGLYAHMLKLLGYETTLHNARVFVDGQWRLVHSHCVVVVKVAADDESGSSELWVSDVGFAASPHVPLRWDLDAGQEQAGDAEWAGFRFTKMVSEVEADEGATCVLFERRSLTDGLWHKALVIYPEPRELHELIPPCDALQADPNAHFNKRVFISAVSETKRKTLSGMRRLITTTFGADGVREEQALSLDVDPPEDAQKEKAAYLQLLKREFNLELTPDEQAALDLVPSARNTHLF